MRVGFAGTPEFAVQVLDALYRAGHTIPVVLTRPDRPSGRGLAIHVSPVAERAARYGLLVMKPASLRDDTIMASLEAIPLDALVVAAYGMILPPRVLSWPSYGCLNVHASLLPRWRGAAPIARAIEAGDDETGVTIMQMDAGLDTGAVLRMRATPVGPRETAGTLHDKLAALGAGLVVEVLADLTRDDRPEPIAQPASGATWAVRIGPNDTPIDWSQPALILDRRIRSLAPSPGATALWGGHPVKIREAIPMPGGSEMAGARAMTSDADSWSPGTVLRVDAEGIDVACGSGREDGSLRLLRVQPAGGRVMPAAAFAAGRKLVRGARFG